MEKQRTALVDPLPLEPFDRPPYSPPRMSAFSAVRRHWIIALTPLVLFVALAAALIAMRDPVYTASSRLEVNAANLSQPGALSGFAVASQSIAATYARSVSSGDVFEGAAKRAQVPVSTVQGSVSASPIPEAPVFVITAQTSDADLAVRLANATADASVDYLNAGGTRSRESAKTFYDSFVDAQRSFQRAKIAQAQAQRDFLDDDSDANRNALAKARVATQAASARAEGWRRNYIESLSGVVNVANVDVLSKASGASSDRADRAELYLFIAVVAGLFAGVGLATARGNAVVRRRMAAATSL